MSSLSSYEYYDDLKRMSKLRAIAETLFTHRNDAFSIEHLVAAQAYLSARRQPGITVTDMPIYPEACRYLGLPADARILNDNHGAIIGRKAKARRLYNLCNAEKKKQLEEITREAVFAMQHKSLVIAEAVIGLDLDLMIKARMITTHSDVANVWHWLHNFAAFQRVRSTISPKHPVTAARYFVRRRPRVAVRHCRVPGRVGDYRPL